MLHGYIENDTFYEHTPSNTYIKYRKVTLLLLNLLNLIMKMENTNFIIVTI